MTKRILALLISALMTVSMFALVVGCSNGTTDEVSDPPNGTDESTPSCPIGCQCPDCVDVNVCPYGGDAGRRPFANTPGGGMHLQNSVWADNFFELRQTGWAPVADRVIQETGRFHLQMPFAFNSEALVRELNLLQLENFDWFVYIRPFVEGVTVTGYDDGTWVRVPVHADSHFLSRGFRLMWHIIQDPNGNRTWNDDMFQFDEGVEYEVIMAIEFEGDYVASGNSIFMTLEERHFEAIRLYEELYEKTGLGPNVPPAGMGENVMDDRMIFFFANIDRFIAIYYNMSASRPPNAWNPTGMSGWVGWDAVVEMGWLGRATNQADDYIIPVSDAAVWRTVPAQP